MQIKFSNTQYFVDTENIKVEIECKIENAIGVDRMNHKNNFPVVFSTLSRVQTEVISREVLNMNEIKQMYEYLEDSTDEEFKTPLSHVDQIETMKETPQDIYITPTKKNPNYSSLNTPYHSSSLRIHPSPTLESPLYSQIKNQFNYNSKKATSISWKSEYLKNASNQVSPTESELKIAKLNIFLNLPLFEKIVSIIELNTNGMTKENFDNISSLSSNQVKWEYLAFKLRENKKEELKKKVGEEGMNAVRYRSWSDFCRIFSRRNLKKHWIKEKEILFYIDSLSGKLNTKIEQMCLNIPENQGNSYFSLLIPLIEADKFPKKPLFPFSQLLTVKVPKALLCFFDRNLPEEKFMQKKLSSKRNLFEEFDMNSSSEEFKQEIHVNKEGLTVLSTLNSFLFESKQKVNKAQDDYPLVLENTAVFETIDLKISFEEMQKIVSILDSMEQKEKIDDSEKSSLSPSFENNERKTPSTEKKKTKTTVSFFPPQTKESTKILVKRFSCKITSEHSTLAKINTQDLNFGIYVLENSHLTNFISTVETIRMFDCSSGSSVPLLLSSDNNSSIFFMSEKKMKDSAIENTLVVNVDGYKVFMFENLAENKLFLNLLNFQNSMEKKEGEIKSKSSTNLNLTINNFLFAISEENKK